jgi:hypothetical protein
MILFKGKIDILPFIGFLDFSINKMLYLSFYVMKRMRKISYVKHLKYKRKELAI